MLTTEQKINMLVLSGWEPALDDGGNPRIVKGAWGDGINTGSVIYNNRGRSDDDAWHGYFRGNNDTQCAPSVWDSIDGVGEIPDELIYEAIGADDET